MSDPFVVVGADAAGLSAASKFRREAPDREVVVFEKGRWISYAYCGMPYFIEGRVERMSNLSRCRRVRSRSRGIDLRRDHEVIAVDSDTKTVAVETAEGETIEQGYDDCWSPRAAAPRPAPSTCAGWTAPSPFTT